MSLAFDASAGLIVVPTKIYGPTGDVIARLALDTGATMTMMIESRMFSARRLARRAEAGPRTPRRRS